MFYRVWAPHTIVTDSLFGKVLISYTDILVYITLIEKTNNSSTDINLQSQEGRATVFKSKNLNLGSEFINTK